MIKGIMKGKVRDRLYNEDCSWHCFWWNMCMHHKSIYQKPILIISTYWDRLYDELFFSIVASVLNPVSYVIIFHALGCIKIATTTKTTKEML